MNLDTLNIAKNETQRFLRKLEDLRRALKDDSDGMIFITGCKESGALRRASMDLTRALSELRKS